MKNAVICSSGNVSSFSAGAVDNARLLVCVGESVSGLPDSDVDFTGEGTIAKLSVKGIKGETYSFCNSVFAASQLGSVSLKDVQVDNSGSPFGLAGLYMKSVKYNVSAEKFSYSELDGPADSVADDDFGVRLF